MDVKKFQKLCRLKSYQFRIPETNDWVFGFHAINRENGEDAIESLIKQLDSYSSEDIAFLKKLVKHYTDRNTSWENSAYYDFYDIVKYLETMEG